MWEILLQGLMEFTRLYFGAQAMLFVCLVLWVVWTDAIRPRLVPTSVIDGIADDIIADYDDPESEASARHERAWHRSDGAEITHWHRVRKRVRRRLRLRQGRADDRSEAPERWCRGRDSNPRPHHYE